MKNIIWKNIPGINGYGDALNRLSYLYRSNEDTIVKCSFHDKIENWKKVNFVRKNVLVRNPNFRMNCTQGRFFERLSVKYRITPWYLNPKHDYWPARVMHNKKSTGKVAFHFYFNNFAPNVRIMLDSLEFFCKEYRGDVKILEKNINALGLETVHLYDVDDNRGFKVMKNPVECIQANMEILQNCDYYVGSEGFMAHVCRAMRVPGLFYRNDRKRYDYIAISNTLEQPIHSMVSSEEEILFHLKS